jgi:hypothetical protein
MIMDVYSLFRKSLMFNLYAYPSTGGLEPSASSAILMIRESVE